jgi:hypothetical protein
MGESDYQDRRRPVVPSACDTGAALRFFTPLPRNTLIRSTSHGVRRYPHRKDRTTYAERMSGAYCQAHDFGSPRARPCPLKRPRRRPMAEPGCGRHPGMPVASRQVPTHVSPHQGPDSAALPASDTVSTRPIAELAPVTTVHARPRQYLAVTTRSADHRLSLAPATTRSAGQLLRRHTSAALDLHSDIIPSLSALAGEVSDHAGAMCGDIVDETQPLLWIDRVRVE